MSAGKWFNNMARLIKHNGKYFVEFGRPSRKNKQTGEFERYGDSPFPITINEGDTLQAKLKKDSLTDMVAKGILSQEQANQIGERVKFEFDLAPPREGKQEPKPTNGTPKNKKDEVDF